MSIISINVVDQALTITNAPMISAGDIKTDHVKFTFDSNWTGYGKTAVFFRDDNKEDIKEVALDQNNQAVVPHEVTAEDGKIWIGVVGVKSNGQTITSEVIWYEIVEGVYTGAMASRSAEASIYARILEVLEAMKAAVGSPLTASTAAAMTDQTKIYVYTGSESGYTNGNWYYYDGSAWVSGGVYNSMAFETDTTLSVEDMAADAKAVGDMFYGGTIRDGLFPKTIVGFSTSGYSPENPFGVLDLPLCSFAAFTNVVAFSDAPPDLQQTNPGRYCVYRLPCGVSHPKRSLVLLYDQNRNQLYINTVFDEGNIETLGTWDKVITLNDVFTLYQATVATDLGILKQIAYANETGSNYYKTKLQDAKLEEINTDGSWTIGENIQPDGTIKSFDYIASTLEDDVFFPSSENVTYYYGGSKYGRLDGRFYVFLHEYDSNGVWLRRTGFLDSTDHDTVTPVTTGANCANVRFVFAYNAASSLKMTQRDIDNYAIFYKEVAAE